MRWFLICFLAFSALADEVALVRVGDNWTYFKGTAEPPKAWTQLAFDDFDWSVGASGFALSFGGEATGLSDMFGNYVSAYFRKTCTIASPELVKWLTLRLDYNGGFIAYLNGQEVARRNMPGPIGSAVSYDALATNFHQRANVEEIDLSAFAKLLTPGTNVLAIQAHNAAEFDSNFVLVPELLANFTRGPFVQNASTNSIQVIWKTPVAATAAVEYGTNSLLGSEISVAAPNTTHALALTNLVPDTTYYYRARSSRNRDIAVSPTETFRTLKMSGPISFVAFGDSGAGSGAQFQIARVIEKAKPDLALHAGDIIYQSFITSLADTRCLSVYGPHMKNTPYYFAIGNHDLYSGAQHFLDAFYLPTNSVSAAEHSLAGTSPEHYYSFDHGDAHFTVLFIPYLSQYKLKAGDAQYRWLTNDLATTSKPWKILLFHVPLETSSAHRFDDHDFNGIADRFDIKDVILPVASRYEVQLVLSGHDHVYERLNPTNGVTSIVTGGGGVGLYGLTQLDAASALIWSRHHCVKVTIEGDTLEAQALGLDGNVFDAMTIQRRVPPRKLLAATWHSPVLETAPPNDEQGNIFGQSFDFQGTAVPALTGQFSNLGRVYVNNDRINLYVGLDRVMIYGNNNIFLFVESPRLPGVQNLLSAGNGLVDPQGEGADGLDFLANLSFTNFAPSVGCILGDEFGDGQFRSFSRTNLPFNIGQGAFGLNASLRDVPGVRLQQFNLSPQIGGSVGEENANFIEIALPLRELGGLQPGDRIKIGAVVAGPTVNTNVSQQSRLLDTGFLGSQMTGSGQGSVILEGLEVQLAVDPDADNDGLTRAEELVIGTNPEHADSDNDGLLDGWEVKHQLSPLSSLGNGGSDGDPDGDNFTNAAEQLAGTDPRDAKSALRVRIEAFGKQQYRISWPAVPARKYEIQVASSPLAGFVSLASTNFPMTATSTNLSYEENLQNAAASSRFYRVRLVP
jgi:hypothetical protein